MRNSSFPFLLGFVVSLAVSPLLGQPDTSLYRYHQDFMVTETAGVARTGEPVRFVLPSTTGEAGISAHLVWDRTNQREVPAQLTPRADGGVEVLLVVNQPARTTVDYRLYYGSPKPALQESGRLKVSGEDLAWQVENTYLVVDFTRNPGTGRNGQINRIFAKRPGIWLSRERDQSTLHLSPNAAGREHYLPVNRWDPPEKWSLSAGPVSFRLERSGPMPRLPQLRARIVYEVFADSPLILVEEEIETRETVELTLLRVGEFTFAPDPKNPFTNLVWGDTDKASEASRNENPAMPLDVPWLGFVQRPANFGFVSVLDDLRTSAPAGGAASLLNPETRFSGTPAHYFWRAFVTNNVGEAGPTVTIPAGSRYRLRYWLYWLEPGNPDPLAALCDVWKAVKNPLRVQLATEGGGRSPKLQTPSAAALRNGTLRALHWLGRDFSFLLPGEDGATIRALAHELELSASQTAEPDLLGPITRAGTLLRKHNLAQRLDLARAKPSTVPQTVSVNLGCGPSPVILEIISSSRGSQIASHDVRLGQASQQTEEISLDPVGTTWLVLKAAGRPEGGESRRLRLTVGDRFVDLLLRSQEAPLSPVQISFCDQATGKKIPVAVQLYAANGRLLVPAGALDFGKLGFLYEGDHPIHYADWSSAGVRSLDPHFGSSSFRNRPVFESACFYVDGELTTRLPAGGYRLTASRGLEYKPSHLVIDILPEQPFHGTVKLERWTDMAALGWYSGDGHVHAERITPETNDLIATWAAAQDVALCNVLLMGDEERTYYAQYAYGPEGRYVGRGTVLAPGQEDPRTTELGHTLHLNIQAPVRFPDRYADYREVFSAVRGQGALSGFAHVGRQHWFFHAERGISLLAPLGLVDFVEIAQMGYIGVERWFDFLNFGFRLTAMAGSDVPWGGTLGNTRVYAYTGGTFSPDAWFDAVRQGHTFVTTGPMLQFTANGEAPGSLLRLTRGQKVQVSAKAWGWGPHQPESVQIVVSGETAHRATRRDSEESLVVDWEFSADRSMWVTALARTASAGLRGSPAFFEGAVATPVYVQVEGR